MFEITYFNGTTAIIKKNELEEYSSLLVAGKIVKIENYSKKQRQKDMDAANTAFHKMGILYHPKGALFGMINLVLKNNNFQEIEEDFICGKIGRKSLLVGHNVFITVSWYEMPSGQYELLCYLS